jgi:hypothetical protein
MTAPSSQKADARPISFVFWDRAGGAQPQTMTLAIRPEELTRAMPSRAVVQQTLGDPYVDSFGEGLPTITLAGHTGWRPGLSSSDPGDGLARFQALKEMVFTNWHRRRAAAIEAGLDPDGVELTFSDALDNFSVRVMPMQFVLRRSRSRPLLCQYQIQLVELTTELDAQPLEKKLSALEKQKLGLASLTDSINKIAGQINNVKAWIDATLVAPVKAFMQQTQALFSAVKNVVAAVDGVAGSLISVAQMAAQAGANLFRSLATVAALPSLAKQRLMEIGSAYVNVFCVMKNALLQKVTFQSFDGILGASGCSSTAGGAPLSAFGSGNTFASVLPLASKLPVSLTSGAQSGLAKLAQADIVNAPLSSGDLKSAVTAASTMVVTA